MTTSRVLLESAAALAVGAWLCIIFLRVRVPTRLTPKAIIGTMLWILAASSLMSALLPRSSLIVVVPGELPSVLPQTFLDASHLTNFLFLATLAVGLAYCSVHRLPSRKGKVIWVTGLILTFAILLSSFFGTLPKFEWKVAIWPLTLTLFYLLPRVPLRWLVAQINLILMVIIVGSLISAFVAPAWAYGAVASPLSHLFQLFNRTYRLQGLTVQANTTGEVALLGFLTSYWLRGAPLRRTSLVLCLVALAMSGSRTSMIALFVAMTCMWIYTEWTHHSLKILSTALLFGVSAVGVLYVAFEDFTGTGYGFLGNLGTLNGRSQVWSLTLDEWRRSPLVGYGPTLWSAAYRTSHGFSTLTWVGQAHNQFIQTLGEEGIIGLIALVAFLLALLDWAWKSRAKDRGLSLSLLLALLVLMIAETPLSIDDLPVTLYPAFVVVIIIMTAATLGTPGGEPLESGHLVLDAAQPTSS